MSYDYRRTQHCVGNGPSQPPAHSIWQQSCGVTP
jgi:hypothetical protein